MTFQSDGSLLIEVATPEESLKLQALAMLNGTPAKCSPHRSLNQCKGVIRPTHLLKYSEEGLLKEFESQKVVEVKKMNKSINGVLTPLPTYVLTLDLVQLPQKLKAAWLRLQIRPYVPASRSFFYCQKFGHVCNSCRQKLRGEKSVIILEREIQTVRAKENIPFSEAKRIVLSRFIHLGVSFASVLQKARTVPKPTVTKSSPVGDQLAKTESSSSKSNPKRRLSGDDKHSSPSSKANRYETLTDSNDHNDIFYDVVSDTDPIMCSSG